MRSFFNYQMKPVGPLLGHSGGQTRSNSFQDQTHFNSEGKTKRLFTASHSCHNLYSLLMQNPLKITGILHTFHHTKLTIIVPLSEYFLARDNKLCISATKIRLDYTINRPGSYMSKLFFYLDVIVFE